MNIRGDTRFDRKIQPNASSLFLSLVDFDPARSQLQYYAVTFHKEGHTIWGIEPLVPVHHPHVARGATALVVPARLELI
ncbi:MULTISPECIES: hypothetical protein [Saccharopolyspora]|uniref:hypothetical protein n=1 Tax=Saccharopolyspora TaxID=1835 RepID=UPI0014047571|nr:hypothetical protein [Saccharopolyspora elongata]